MDLSSHPLDATTFQQIVSFLRRNGLTESEEALTKEAAAVLRVSRDSVHVADPTKDEVFQQYSDLLVHINASFDPYRAELSSLLFPMFAYLFIQQMLEGHCLSAALFCKKFKTSVPPMYGQQVDSLSRIQTHTQALSHPLVETLTKNRFAVRLSKSAIKQLEPFLSRNERIKDFIQDHLVIETMNGSRSKGGIEAAMGGIVGEITKHDRKYKMYYGVTKEETYPFSSDRRRSKGRERNESKKKDVNAPVPDRIPLPSVSETLTQSNKELLTKKVKISSESLPSVCLYTVSNAPGGVSAVDISENSNFLALGFGSSRISVQAIGDEKFRNLKAFDQLEEIDPESDSAIEQIYDDSSGDEDLTFTGHAGPVYSVSFSPDVRLLLSSSADSTLRLWSIAARQNVVVYREAMPIWQAKFCSRSYYFATGGSDGTAKLWTTDRTFPLRIFSDAFSDVSCIDFHPNCNYIAGGSDDRYVRVWDVLSGTCVRCFSGHKGTVGFIKTSPCGRYLASAGKEGSVIVWDLAMQQMLCKWDSSQFHSPTAIAFSRDGSALAIAHSDNGLSFLDMDTVISYNVSDQTKQDPKINPIDAHLNTYYTKNTPILDVHFNRKNLVFAVGSFGQR